MLTCIKIRDPYQKNPKFRLKKQKDLWERGNKITKLQEGNLCQTESAITTVSESATEWSEW